MTDQVQPGFICQGTEQELIVVARPEARLRARPDGVRSAADADVSALGRFLDAEQLVLEPLFGSEERLRRSGSTGAAGLPDLALFYRVRGGERRVRELRAGIAELPGIDTAYVKPGALPAASRTTGASAAEGVTVTPDLTGRQGYLKPAPEGVDAHWAWERPGGTGRGVTVIDVGGAWQLGHEGSPPSSRAWSAGPRWPTWPGATTVRPCSACSVPTATGPASPGSSRKR